MEKTVRDKPKYILISYIVIETISISCAEAPKIDTMCILNIPIVICDHIARCMIVYVILRTDNYSSNDSTRHSAKYAQMFALDNT